MTIQSRNKHRRRYAAPVGGLFLLLAIVGVITLIVGSINLTIRALDNTDEKEAFAELIRPVAMFDPSPFEDPADIDAISMLRYGMWATLKSEKRDSYTFDDYAELVVPASDMDVAIGKLFGPEIKLEHQSFGDSDLRYVYDEEAGVYHVPIAAQLLVYSPEVIEITSDDGDYYNLLVGYVPPETAWTDAGGPEPEKYMIYVMKKSGDSYQIAKVQNPPTTNSPGNINAGVAQSQAETAPVPEAEEPAADAADTQTDTETSQPEA